MTVEQKTTVQFDILLAINGEDSYGRGGVFHPLASVGSSHNRLTSAEENEEALLLGCPPIGLLDRRILGSTVASRPRKVHVLCSFRGSRPDTCRARLTTKPKRFWRLSFLACSTSQVDVPCQYSNATHGSASATRASSLSCTKAISKTS